MSQPISSGVCGPLPLVLGVTGHRDLRDADRPALAEQVRRILIDLRERYPATPLLLLSSLAEGADRLVAQVALDCGARLIAPLPLPRSLFEQDFATTDSRAEFADLVGRAEQCIELPLVPGNTLDSVSAPGEPRNRQYALAGAWIARHCQILLALWDGEDAHLQGGTAQIAGFKRDGVPPLYGIAQSPLDPVECGPVYRIATPRLSNPQPKGTPFVLYKHFPGPAADCERIYHRMNTFNDDALRLAGHLAHARERSKGYLLGKQEQIRVPAPLQELLDWYATADTLAMHFQRYALRLLAWLMILAFVAAFFFNLSDQLDDRLWGRIAYVVVLAVAYGLTWWARWGDYESKYLDYRALAEGLRVQFFWRLAGLTDAAADHYLRKQRSELDWIRDAMRVWGVLAVPVALERMDMVQDSWVKAQHGYYAKAAPRDQQTLKRWRLYGNLFFATGLAWAAFKLVLGLFHRDVDTLALRPVLADSLQGVVVLVSLAPVVAALLFSYAKTRALSEHAKQYGRMAQTFATAEERLRELLEVRKLENARELLRELGKESLAENGDWVQLHRDRPIQVPG